VWSSRDVAQHLRTTFERAFTAARDAYEITEEAQRLRRTDHEAFMILSPALQSERGETTARSSARFRVWHRAGNAELPDSPRSGHGADGACATRFILQR
jgi:hypothetical protein